MHSRERHKKDRPRGADGQSREECTAGSSCGGLIATTATKNRPINIRAQVFAADLAVRCPLYQRAIFGWHIATSMPVIHHLGNDANGLCQSRLAAKHLISTLKVCHAPIINTWGMKCQQVVFAYINNRCSF
jgi:hypothetical protein